MTENNESNTNLTDFLNKISNNKSWTDENGLVVKFKQNVLSMNSNQLQKYWPKLIPLLLQLASSYPNNLEGVLLVKHVISFLPGQFVQRNGVDQMLLHNLTKLFYQTDSDLLLETFNVVEILCERCSRLSQTLDQVEQNQIDNITNILLGTIQITSDHRVKCVCIQLLPRLYLLMGKRVWKHLKQLLEVYSELLNVELGLGNVQEKAMALVSFNCLIKHCEQINSITFNQFGLILMKFNYELITHQKKSENHELKIKLDQCIESLKKYGDSDKVEQMIDIANKLIQEN